MPGLIPHPLLAPTGDHRHADSKSLNTWQQYFTFDSPAEYEDYKQDHSILNAHIFKNRGMCHTASKKKGAKF
jgi:hypothetical protein